MAAPGRAEETGGPGAGTVCVRLPAKPIKSVTVRKPPGLKIRKGGPGAGTVCVRLPAKPMNSVFVRKPPGRVKQKKRPANEEACIVKQLLTMQASSISIVYCSPCELSPV